MDKRRREQYRKKLDLKRTDLETLIARTGEAGRTTGAASSEDTAELAANSYAKELLFRQSDTELAQLRLVEQALTRTTSTDFGRCQTCDELIDKKRLDAVPWARNCRDCQEAEEQQGLDAIDSET
jgi:DnaK suppressor protein